MSKFCRDPTSRSSRGSGITGWSDTAMRSRAMLPGGWDRPTSEPTSPSLELVAQHKDRGVRCGDTNVHY